MISRPQRGIASSASAFASLALAASQAAGLALSEKQLSILARKGSGSACRSIPGGFVQWEAGTDDDSSFAYQIAPADHWDIRITTVIFNEQPKMISSSEGHRAAKTSPFYSARLDTLPCTLACVKQALLVKDFQTFGLAVEKEAISMHAIAMTAQPKEYDWLSGIYYWSPETMRLIQAVQDWRHNGLAVYFTIDAGPNIHLVCQGQDQGVLEQEVSQVLSKVGGSYLLSEPARGAWLM